MTRCKLAGTFALFLSIGVGLAVETGSVAVGDVGSLPALPGEAGGTGGQAASGTPILSAALGAPVSVSPATVMGPREQDADAGEPGSQPFIAPDRLEWHVPDPESARQRAVEDLERARKIGDKRTINNLTRVLERIDTIRRPERLHLSLQDALRRALANNYVIQTLSYNPAVETTRVVEAQAAFDAVFFANVTKNKVDRPTGSQLFATNRDFFRSATGIRKLLASGMQVSGSYELTRTRQDFAFQFINPEYFSSFVLEARQPILRGFGLDFNRSLILIAKNDRRISDLDFRVNIINTVFEIERRYWELVQARRDAVVSARMLADFEAIYEYLIARRDFDILPVQIDATKARVERTKADFVRRRRTVLDAEDRLIGVMNDPEINLADDTEIVPSDAPRLERIVLDRLAEIQTALDNNPEIKKAEFQVAKAKVFVGRAKNAELPRLDLTFRVTADGLAGTTDRSFDELTRNKFIEYFIGVALEVPIGNRGPRAAHHRARLQHSQAVAALRGTFEAVIQNVNITLRNVQSSFNEIAPSMESAEAGERQVESIVARAERKDMNTLLSELNAVDSLAAARRAMLQTVVAGRFAGLAGASRGAGYNVAIVNLERAKGTLLQYNNVVISTEAD